jgi:hypothetical protein
MYRFGVLSLLLGGLPLGACGSSSHPEAPREAVIGVDSGAVLLQTGYSGFSQSDRFVVRDQVHWARVWDTAFAAQTPVPPPPAVDFTKDMVVVAALGSRPTGGYGIAIKGVAPEPDGAEVLVATTAPGDDCVTTHANTQPVVMVRVGAVAGLIRFHERAETHSCR